VSTHAASKKCECPHFQRVNQGIEGEGDGAIAPLLTRC